MKKNILKITILISAMSFCLVGCTLFPSKEEKEAERQEIIDAAVATTMEQVSSSLAGYVTVAQMQGEIASVKDELTQKIDGVTSLTDAQKLEVKSMIAEAITVPEEEEPLVAESEGSDKKGQTTKTTTETTTSQSNNQKNNEKFEMTDEVKKEIDKRVATQMATIISDAGIVVEGDGTAKKATGTMTEEEKTNTINNIQTLFTAHNTLVKDLETLNKKVGENTQRIDILCSEDKTTSISSQDRAAIINEAVNAAMQKIIPILIELVEVDY